MNSVDVLIDMYTMLKEYIPAKERQAAADQIMSLVLDSLDDSEIKEFASVDKYLETSYREAVGEFEDDDVNEDDIDYDYNDD